MLLLRALRCILCCGQDDEEHLSFDNRRSGDYSTVSPPILQSRSKPPHRSNSAADSPRAPHYRDDAQPLLPPARYLTNSRGNLTSSSVISHGDRTRTIFSATGSSEKPAADAFFSNLSTPSLSTSVRAPAPAPSSKPSFGPVSSANCNISVAGLSIGPEKLRITKDSAKCLPERPQAAPLSFKFQPPSISSSAAPSPPSKETPSAISSGIISASGNPVVPEKLQISPSPVTRTPNTSHTGTLLSKFPSASVSSSTRDSISQAPQLNASLSTEHSSADFLSTDSSIPGASSRVWQLKFLIPLDSVTRNAEKTSSSSPSLHLNKDSVSPAPLSKPSLSPISTANISFAGVGGKVWRKKKQLTESGKNSEKNMRSFSLTSVKVPSPDSSSSETSFLSSEDSSSSPLLESHSSTRRVLLKYEIPKHLEEMIKKDIVPPVLKCPLSPSTYGDYFATLLYAEDFYLEKWSGFLLEDVTLELRPRISSAYSPAAHMKRKNIVHDHNRDFVAFKIDSVPEKRPYLLSRDFVFLQPVNGIAEPFKGILFRVVKSVILVEFGDDFHSQHFPPKRYNVSFSFNRVCLKRAHQAISVATDPSFHSILFPDQSFSPLPKSFHFYEKAFEVQDPVTRIANHKGPIPYLVQGQLSVVKDRPSHLNDEEIHLTFTGNVIKLAMLSIYRANPCCKILVCSPSNNTSDVLLRSLRKEIPEASFFRANAAFRNYGLVPDDIVLASLYEDEEEHFACPPLTELLNFNVITCTFMSSFRLHSAGIDPRHFSHIFLVDACLATEPEAIVPLANLAGKNTAIVVTGCHNNSPAWVRSEIARRRGLKISYFHRLLEREPYRTGDATFIAKIAC